MTILAALLLFLGASASWGAISSQCPGYDPNVDGDLNGDGIIRADDGEISNPITPNQVCMHLSAGDGFVTMADGKELYMFGFGNVTGVPDDQVVHAGMLGAAFPSPEIVLQEGDEFYLSLSNVGMMMRPDLFDPHTVHWHGFPNAASVFDGVPAASISIKMGSTLTYYYKVVEVGTFMYHCHVEATEHMQMGMLGNLWVEPAQNKLADGTPLNGFIHQTGNKYAYNDGDGSTLYDLDYPLQLGSFDGVFHDASLAAQPLPFALMNDNYAMLNGRGYPDTLEKNPLPPTVENGIGKVSQFDHSLIEGTSGDKILLRISNLNVTRFYTLSSPSMPMTVIGKDTKMLRGTDPDGNGPLVGENLFYNTNSVNTGGGEAYDVILDTTGIAPGTYFLYTTNLNYLSNDKEDFGGMMTEIIIN